MTDSGKFIEIERNDAIDGKEPETEVARKPEADVKASASPNQSPGKSVRIKENGATNGDNNEAVRLLVFLCLI